MSTREPLWKRQTEEKFDHLLAPGEELLAVTGGSMFGRQRHYFYVGLSQRRLILLDLEGWIGKVLGVVGIRLPRAGYSIHRSMVFAAELEKTAGGTKLTLGLPARGEKLVFEQAALGAEELVEAWRSSDEADCAASAQDWVESARALNLFGLKRSAQLALDEARKAQPARKSVGQAAILPDRWQEEREAYRTAGAFMAIIIGTGAVVMLFSFPAAGWSLELCSQYVVAVLAAVVLLRPLFQDPPAGRKGVFARIGTTMLLLVVLLIIWRDYELLVGIAGAYVAVILLLTGKPSRARRRIAIGVFAVSVVVVVAAATRM